MKQTGMIERKNDTYQFAAVEKGEKLSDILDTLGWNRENRMIFDARYDEIELDRWQHWFDEAGVEIDMNNVIIIIEWHKEVDLPTFR